MSETVERTMVEVKLAGGMTWTQRGDMEMAQDPDGSLVVWDYREPREGNGIVFIATKGEWLGAAIRRLAPPPNHMREE